MNRTTTPLLLGVIIAMGIGLYGTSGFLSDSQSTALSSNSYMTGHLTLTAYDENGNVKAYRQTDNVVLNTGDNCIAAAIFTHSSGSTCTTADFQFIAIGTGSNATTPAEAWVDPLPITYTTDLDATGNVVLTEVTSGTGGAATKLTAAFLNVGANIDEAAIRSATGSGSAGNALAYQQFTVINLGGSDDLTVEWTVTIDGN